MRLMGFFDFLRKKKVEEKVRKELSIDEIKAKISEEEAVLRNKSLKFEEMTKSLIDILIPKLKNSLIPLRSINLEKRREDETLKGIVRENLNLYSSQLENFIGSLERAKEETDSNGYIIRIGIIFENFSRSSSKSYQKANILVGAEFETIQKEFKVFFREFKPIMGKNIENRGKIEKLDELTSKLQKISESAKSEERTKNIILSLDTEKEQKDAELVKREEEIKNLRGSEQYKNGIEERKRTEKELVSMENDLNMLQKKIDLKDLARLYHKNEQKHKIIQKFILDFREAMEKDERIEFTKIIKETRGLDVDFKEITEKRKRLVSYVSESEIKEREIEIEIEKIKNKIYEIENNKKTGEKKLENFREEKESLVNELNSKAEEYFLVPQ